MISGIVPGNTMRQTRILVALCMAVGLLAAGAAGVVAQEQQEEADDEISPGEQLSGVVGVGEAEFEGELADSAFAIGLERADDNATRASEIANRLNDSETRLAELEERRDRLDAQRESGEISEGEYRARTARLATETANVQRQLNRSEAAADGIPGEILEANGVNVSSIETLRRNASELSGPEVSEIARSIAGERRGELPGAADRAGNATAGPDDRPEAGDQADGDERPDATDDGAVENGTDTGEAGGEDGAPGRDETEDDTSDRDGDGGTDTSGGAEAGGNGSGGQGSGGY
jgi:hypothetical protein